MTKAKLTADVSVALLYEFTCAVPPCRDCPYPATYRWPYIGENPTYFCDDHRPKTCLPRTKCALAWGEVVRRSVERLGRPPAWTLDQKEAEALMDPKTAESLVVDFLESLPTCGWCSHTATKVVDLPNEDGPVYMCPKHLPGDFYLDQRVVDLDWGAVVRKTQIALGMVPGSINPNPDLKVEEMLENKKKMTFGIPPAWKIGNKVLNFESFSKPYFRHACTDCTWLGGFLFDLPSVCLDETDGQTRYVDLYAHWTEKLSKLYVRYGHDRRQLKTATFHGVKSVVEEKVEDKKVGLIEGVMDPLYLEAFLEAYRRTKDWIEKEPPHG